jgi:hypothetical protein
MRAQKDAHHKERKGTRHAPDVKKMQAAIREREAVSFQDSTILVI